jgi:hypothetical protein
MKKLVAVAATLVLGVAASTAAADMQYAVQVTRSPTGSPIVFTPLANATGQEDGVFTTFTNTGGNGVRTLDVIFRFTNTVSAPGLTVWGLSQTGGVTLDAITWQDNAQPGNSQSGSVTLGVAVPGASTNYEIYTATNAYNGDGWQVGVYNHAILTFTFQDGATLSIDAVSNPEPGTMALFALGAAGLGGFAWKRRKARVAKRTA